MTWTIETTDGQAAVGHCWWASRPTACRRMSMLRARASRCRPIRSRRGRSQSRSLMPDGLERLLTVEEFRDLLAYLKPVDPRRPRSHKSLSIFDASSLPVCIFGRFSALAFRLSRLGRIARIRGFDSLGA